MSHTSSSFQGADVGAMEKVVREFTSAAEKVDQTISYVQALIVALKAAGFFTGGASVAYANYLQSTVLPWLRKISMALKMAIQVLRTQISDQTQASSLATLGIEQLGYRTPQLPTSDTRSYPTMTLPVGGGAGTGAPSTGEVTSPTVPAIGGGTGVGAGLGTPGSGSLTSPTPGGGAHVSVGGSTNPAPGGSTIPPAYVGGGSLGGVGGGGPLHGRVGTAPFDPASGGAVHATSAGLGGSGAGAWATPLGGGAAAAGLGAGLGSTGAGGSGSSAGGGGTSGSGAGSGVMGSGIGSFSDGGAIGGDLDTASSGEPGLRSRDAIGGAPSSGFAGRQSFGDGGAIGGEVAGELRASSGGTNAGLAGAGLGLAGAGALALRKGGQRILGGDGQDLFTPGDGGGDAGTDR